LKKVMPYFRTSGRKPDAEKRRRSARVAPQCSAGTQPAIS
jgi:hypothetical protein